MKNSFVAITIIIVVLISGSIGYVVGTSNSVTTTQATTQTVTDTTTQYSTITSTAQNPCSWQFASGATPFNAPKIFAIQNSSIMICTRLYYYNSTSSKSFNTSSLLNVGVGDTASHPSKMNFRVNAFPSEVTIGGASNVSEGTLVLYTITTGDSSNGTYVVNFEAALYPSLEICGQFTQFVVSNSVPFYGYNPSCTTPVQGDISVEVIGMSNSTVNLS